MTAEYPFTPVFKEAGYPGKTYSRAFTKADIERVEMYLFVNTNL